MADPQPNAAAVTPSQGGPAQPAQAPADDGFERVSRDEYQTLKRNNERLRGMEGFYQKAQQVGFKRPEDLDGYAKFNAALDKKGIKRDALMQALMAEEQDHGGEQPNGGLDFASIEKQLGGKYIARDQFESELNKRDAMYAHKSAAQQEQAMVQKHIDALIAKAGDNAGLKSIIPDAFDSLLNKKRGLYPESHPLHSSELAVYDEKGLTAIVAEFEKRLGLSEAAEIAAAGDAANGKKKIQTPAGSSNHTPSKPPKASDNERRPGNLPSRNAVEAEWAKRQARRGGGTMSSAGG